MYVTGRWVSTNVVGTMFIAWVVVVVIFLGVLGWQLRKRRKGNSIDNRHRGSARPSSSKKTKRRRRGIQ